RPMARTARSGAIFHSVHLRERKPLTFARQAIDPWLRAVGVCKEVERSLGKLARILHGQIKIRPGCRPAISAGWTDPSATAVWLDRSGGPGESSEARKPRFAGEFV